MATEAHKYRVGMFVIVSSLIAVATVIWLGASRFFEETQTVVTYFAESVQGLEPGSAVKYRGVPSGRVSAIRIAPDGELIEVIMDLDVKAAKALKQDPRLRATLELSGITGLRFIEIDRRSGDALNQMPELAFAPPYEVIPSSRSSFKAIQAALSDVYDRVMQLDFAGISHDTRTALQAATNVLHDERLDALLTNLKTTSQESSQLVRNLTEMTRDVKLAPAVDNATKATAEAKALFQNLSSGPTGKQFTEAMTQLNTLVQSSQQAVMSLQYTLQRLDRTAGNLQGLTDDLRSQPSRLLFAAPPAQRGNSNEQRK